MPICRSVASVVFGLVLLPGLALAGSLSIYPIRVTLDPGVKTASVKVVNGAGEKVALQVEAMAWSQDAEGKDRYEATSDLAFQPKILTLDAKESRVVRLGFHGAWPAREQSYRLYLRELPRARADQPGLQISLRLGVPVFVVPSKKSAKSEARIDSVEMLSGQVVTHVRNVGGAHLVVDKLAARGLDESGRELWTKPARSWYVLPGVVRSFTAETTSAECLQATKVEVTATVGGTAVVASAMVDRARCGSSQGPPQTAKP